MPQVRDFKISRRLQRLKRCLKVYPRSFSLRRDYSNSLACQMLANSPEVEAVQCVPTARKCLKIIHSDKKKGAIHGQILNSGLAWVLSVLFTPLGEMISVMKYLLSRQLYFVYLSVFFTWGRCLTPKFEAHDRKMSDKGISKADQLQKRIKWVYLSISVLNIHWRSKHVKQWKCLILRFIEDVKNRRRTFFLYEFAYIWQNKWLVIIAKKFERMRIDFLLKPTFWRLSQSRYLELEVFYFRSIKLILVVAARSLWCVRAIKSEFFCFFQHRILFCLNRNLFLATCYVAEDVAQSKMRMVRSIMTNDAEN